MQTEIKAIQRITGDEVYLEMNQGNELLVAQGSARYEDATRTGKRFSFRNTTGVAAVTAIPTVATNCAFCNTDPDGGRSAIIDTIFASQVGNASAALDQYFIIWILGQTRVAQLTDGALIPRKMNGMGPTSDTCLTIAVGGVDLDAVTGVEAGWMPACSSRNSAVTTLPGIHLIAQMDGLIIIPPGRILGLHVVASEATPTFAMGIQWHERILTLA